MEQHSSNFSNQNGNNGQIFDRRFLSMEHQQHPLYYQEAQPFSLFTQQNQSWSYVLPQYQPFAPSPSLGSASYSYPRCNFGSLAPLINHASTTSCYITRQAYQQASIQYRARTIFRPIFDTLSLEDLRGEVLLLAKHPVRYRKLLRKIKEGTILEKQLIFTETLEHLHELMVDNYGTRLVQSIIKNSSIYDITKIICALLRYKDNLLYICQDDRGTRAIQKLLACLKTPTQLGVMLSFFLPITASLVNSKNGSHIIAQCFEEFPPEYMENIANEISNFCLDISKDKHGCIVMQVCLDKVVGNIKHHLVGQIALNAVELSVHHYGNFVVQYIIGMEIPAYTTKIVNQLAGSYVYLSQDKFGSHVAEYCIQFSMTNHAIRIIKEIMDGCTLIKVVQDPYGNYVAQKALECLKNIDKLLFTRIVNWILKDYKHLHCHPHGRRVFEYVRKMKK